MKTVKTYQVIGLAALVFSGSALAEQANTSQNIARRAVTAQAASAQSVSAQSVNVSADQAWEGTSLQVNAAQQKQPAARLFNLQYVSRRSTI